MTNDAEMLEERIEHYKAKQKYIREIEKTYVKEATHQLTEAAHDFVLAPLFFVGVGWIAGNPYVGFFPWIAALLGAYFVAVLSVSFVCFCAVFGRLRWLKKRRQKDG